ncbi:protein PIGMENT DEFECTIVE 338, chloroplastic [Andrographis paniculata]|uniref:protein PIGMENT DEFECTIVE 338, chloroplastic n=1 Tax=Andrographis paniculata TaxID=175694 RepID=UPI0021E7BCEA|nr:protein PIGMENT DEFECTIVE 338, chloroplastic [Andrographis paniculata]
MSILIHASYCKTTNPFFHPFISISPPSKTPNLPTYKSLRFSFRLPKFRPVHVRFCAENGVPRTTEPELLDKPSPKQLENEPEPADEAEVKEIDKEEVLDSFYRFFKPSGEENNASETEAESSIKEEEREEISVEYYEPQAGDFVVGVVVSGNENKLDVNVGADMLGTMLTKDVLPLYEREMEYLLCDLEKDAEEFLAPGKVGIVRYEEAVGGRALPGRPVVEVGTVVFAEVLGRTLGGRPLLSARRFFRRIAWHRVRQIQQLNEPIEVRITEWNTGGLLTRIEGLRGFIPKAELMNRVNNFTELKENVGRRIHVLITRINEDTNDLILSEKEAWEKVHLQEGTLLVGTVKKIFQYGAQIRIGDTNRSGLLHISNISRERITSVDDVLAVDEEVKVLVVKSMLPGKISLSIAELESEPGLFLSDKKRVYSEAEEMAKLYRKKISPVSKVESSNALPMDGLPFGDEERLYSNWKWFRFEKDDDI